MATTRRASAGKARAPARKGAARQGQPRAMAAAGMNELTVSPERLALLRELCLELPDATEKIAWGDPTWRVRDKMFALQKGNYAGGRPSLWLKGAAGAQETLVGANPKLFFVPPYVGHKGWIGIYLDGARLERDVIADLIRESYALVAPTRLAAQLTEGAPGADRNAPSSTKLEARAVRAKAARAGAARKPRNTSAKAAGAARRSAR